MTKQLTFHHQEYNISTQQSSPEVSHWCCCLPRTSSSADIITAVRPPTVTARRTVIAGCRLHVAAESHCDCVATTHCIHSRIAYQDQHSRLHRRSDTVRIPTWLRHYGLRTESARLPHQNPHSITGPEYEPTPTGSTASFSLIAISPLRVFPRSHRSPTAEASFLSPCFRSPLPEPLQAAPLPMQPASVEHSRHTKDRISPTVPNRLLISPFFRIL